MARRKKKRSSGPRLPRVHLTREGTLSGLNVAATVLVFGGVAAGVVLGGPGLAARFEQQRAARDILAPEAGSSPQILINWPDWLPNGERRRLAEIASLALEGAGDTPLSAAPLRAIGSSLFRAGWFESPPRVERLHGGDIEVRADWLEPAFAVRWPPTSAGTVTQRDLVVTRSARLTPMWYPVDGSGLPLVVGPNVGPPAARDGSPAFGRPWGDEAVGHAIALLEVLRPEPYFDQVMGVSAAEYPRSGRLVIITDWSTEIVWGSPPGVDATHRGEVKIPQRLASLRELQQRYTRVDAAQRRLEVFGPAVEIDYSAGRP
jgi:hypothetical protein